MKKFETKLTGYEGKAQAATGCTDAEAKAIVELMQSGNLGNLGDLRAAAFDRYAVVGHKSLQNPVLRKMCGLEVTS